MRLQIGPPLSKKPLTWHLAAYTGWGHCFHIHGGTRCVCLLAWSGANKTCDPNNHYAGAQCHVAYCENRGRPKHYGMQPRAMWQISRARAPRHHNTPWRRRHASTTHERQPRQLKTSGSSITASSWRHWDNVSGVVTPGTMYVPCRRYTSGVHCFTLVFSAIPGNLADHVAHGRLRTDSGSGRTNFPLATMFGLDMRDGHRLGAVHDRNRSVDLTASAWLFLPARIRFCFRWNCSIFPSLPKSYLLCRKGESGSEFDHSAKSLLLSARAVPVTISRIRDVNGLVSNDTCKTTFCRVQLENSRDLGALNLRWKKSGTALPLLM